MLGLGEGFGCGFLIYVQLIFGGALLAYEKHSLSRACGISLGNFLWVEGFLRLGFRLGLGFCWGALCILPLDMFHAFFYSKRDILVLNSGVTYLNKF